MGTIMTRAAVTEIMSDENLTPEQRTEKVMALYGRALDDGYISKNAAQTAQQTALANAKTEWEKNQTKPDIKESEEYKTLQNEFNGYKIMQTARMSDEYKTVKPKFFETVYGMVKTGEGEKTVAEQLEAIKTDWPEYFTQAEPQKMPQFSQNPGRPGVNPESEEDKIFKQISENWK